MGNQHKKSAELRKFCFYLFIYYGGSGRFNGDIKKVEMEVGFRFIEEKDGILN